MKDDTDPAPLLPPGPDALEEMARAAFATIPDELARHAKGLVVRVEEFPDEETANALDLETPFDVLGLYQGVSLDRKSVSDSGAMPDMIFLYRRPILDYWVECYEPLFDIVRHVLIHEIGHHFGFSDDDMARIESES